MSMVGRELPSPLIGERTTSVLVVALTVLAGCGGTPSGPMDTAEPSETTVVSNTSNDSGTPGTDGAGGTTAMPKKHPRLESVLIRLVNADNRTDFASEHGLSVRSGRVEVVIELESGADLPAEYDVNVTTRFENRVQAYVAIDDLLPIAESEGVRMVRTPIQFKPQQSRYDT